MGLRQILVDDSTGTATSDDDGDTVTPGISFTPEEILLRRLQVTDEEQRVIERATIGQHLNVMWTLECKQGETILWKGQCIPHDAVDIVSSTQAFSQKLHFFSSKMQLSIFVYSYIQNDTVTHFSLSLV